MTAAIFAQLLIAFGPQAFDLARNLIAKWNNTEPLTVADIDELQKLGQRRAKDAMIEALVRGGIALDSPQAIALLALVP